MTPKICSAKENEKKQLNQNKQRPRHGTVALQTRATACNRIMEMEVFRTIGQKGKGCRQDGLQ
jgi:hypothetical protein